MRSYDSCERMVSEAAQRHGRLDILVNCAAGNFLSPAEALSSNGFRTVMDIDAVGTFNMSRCGFGWRAGLKHGFGGCCHQGLT